MRRDAITGATWRGRPLPLWMLLALLVVLGVRGVVGGGQFILVPSGEVVGLSTQALSETPFRTFLVPGVILFVGLGVAPLVVVYGLARGARWAWFGALAVAAALATWVLVEGAVIGFGERLQYPNLIQAVAMALLALVPSVRDYCDRSLANR